MIFSTIHSLEKIFPDDIPKEEKEGIAFENERHHFQLYCYSDKILFHCSVKVRSTIENYVTVRKVDVVPVYLANYDVRDDYVLSTKTGLYPDVLSPVENGKITLVAEKTTTFWVTVEGKLPAGEHTIVFELYDEKGTCFANTSYRLKVLAKRLPKADIFVSTWIHYDCLCSKAKVKFCSEKFYKVFHNTLDVYVKSGNNAIYVPVFTEAEVRNGKTKRPILQLIDIEYENGAYRFDFARFDKFIEFCKEHGIEYYEFSHLFTQEGARFPPEILIRKGKRTVKGFGFLNEKAEKKYLSFLEAFLPAFVKHLHETGIGKRCYFHLSDEPRKEDLEQYKRLYRFVKKFIGKLKIIDALSDYEFVAEGCIDVPFVKNMYAKDFIGKNTPFGVYYCCGQNRNYVSNRYLSMPSLRNRILGYQLYLNRAYGFLHWGFNYYYTERSEREVDPYRETDAGCAYPSGDAFIVYPVKDGYLNSLRGEVFGDAIQDYRSLLLLEEKIGREAVVAILKEYGLSGYTDYPHNDRKFLQLRKRIYSEIIE